MVLRCDSAQKLYWKHLMRCIWKLMEFSFKLIRNDDILYVIKMIFSLYSKFLDLYRFSISFL